MADLPPPPPARRSRWAEILLAVLLALVLIAGAYFRFAGLYWGEFTYLHPDERFLLFVTNDISPAESLGQYFDTANSPLNPANRGYPYFVYGTLPVFLTRYLVEWSYDHAGWNEVTKVGRMLAATLDWLTIPLAFAIARRFFGRWAGLLAAAFTAAAVLQIQHAHFYTTDAFITFFSTLALYFAARVATENWEEPGQGRGNLLWLCVGFGVALGCAVASKVNAAPIALALPGAMLIRLARLPSGERNKAAWRAVPYLALGAVASLVAFRIGQPYAFNGPGFFGLGLNSTWLENMRQVQAASAGDIDPPYALQWARRPIWFAGQNIALWGLGLPLGIAAFGGFLWAAWRMLKGDWQRFALLWVWVAIFFAWQSSIFNPTLRYFLVIYPPLAIFAGWAVVELYHKARCAADRHRAAARAGGTRLPALAATLAGGLVVLLTFGYAYGFTQIYLRPITRVAASRWIYQNIPGPANLRIQTQDGITNQPLYSPNGYLLKPDTPYVEAFTSRAAGNLSEVSLGLIIGQTQSAGLTTIDVLIARDPGGQEVLGLGSLDLNLGRLGQQNVIFPVFPPAPVEQDTQYFLIVRLAGSEAGDQNVLFNGPLSLNIDNEAGERLGHILPYPKQGITSARPYLTSFEANATGLISEIYLPELVDHTATPGSKTLEAALLDQGTGITLATGRLEGEFLPGSEGRGYSVRLDPPVPVVAGQDSRYNLSFSLVEGEGALALNGATIANESDFDDALPLRIDGYDAIYPGGVILQSYWPENNDKLLRYLSLLDESDYLVMSSNRQWGSIPRVPERYPMSTIYYRELLGCPAERAVEWCYSVAEPGMFQGQLGFELVQVFESQPTIGPIKLNDQFAEEAFTVYEHPKVLIFRKTEAYDAPLVRARLGSVDFSRVIHLTPKKASAYPADLMLPENRLEVARASGTWTEIFSRESLLNRVQILGVAAWYLAVFALGLITYPLVRIALGGLNDRGYPLARTAGLLLLSYLVWLGGSFGLKANRTMIALMVAILLGVGLVLTWLQRKDLLAEWRLRKKYFLSIEGLFLLFFVFDLLIRLGNPDLWHPWKGGERPMDFSYLNATIKSVTFPPYDPWFASGYLNYYYYGFVMVGTLIELLGIIPSFAFNLILPTIFSLIGLGAFSAAWNLVSAVRKHDRPPDLEPDPTESASETVAEPGDPETESSPDDDLPPQPFWAGLFGALGMAVIGNLGTVRMIWQGYQRLAAPGGVIDEAGLLTRLVWAIRGAALAAGGERLPYALADWYWNPSRVMPPEYTDITEFPFFTVLYGDPHAHLFALPVGLLALGFAISLVLNRARWKGFLEAGLSFLLGALAIGALYPINLADRYTYLGLGLAAVAYTFWRYAPHLPVGRLPQMSLSLKRILAAISGIALLGLLAVLLFKPYASWYGQPYSSITRWEGPTTPTTSYLTHWGYFLFILVTWMAWETYDWMVKTPLSHVRKLQPYREVILFGVLGLVLATVGLLIYGVHVAYLILPLAAWAGVLLLRPNQPDARRIVLFLIGTGLAITLMVEVLVVRGDVNRMNTVFKFYLQAWTLFAAASAAALYWLLSTLSGWAAGWRRAWSVILFGLVVSVALYPVLASTAKIRDRWVPTVPLTLDGMDFMKYASWDWSGHSIDLAQDYRLIQWLQDNVAGSPVIVEGGTRDLYTWFKRATVYTGLPNVVGWEWHQQQQRAFFPQWVSQRITDIDVFYTTTDLEEARAFLEKYSVRYIILGQLEQVQYIGPGLDKFAAQDGALWKQVYHEAGTYIYEVLQ